MYVHSARCPNKLKTQSHEDSSNHKKLTPKKPFYASGLFTYIFFKNLSRDFPVLAVGDNGLCVGLQNKIGHPVRGYRRWMQVVVLSGR